MSIIDTIIEVVIYTISINVRGVVMTIQGLKFNNMGITKGPGVLGTEAPQAVHYVQYICMHGNIIVEF